ncbi:UNC93-like protein MFSD11 [Phymastichus coffea]|uniref:UNC93-like protein MFSD11 n=1 Tax=Phymastichus coffea TaxID=108790 RepID=UPI00273B31D2|nr:UNC93-like protein MFSD11 [Phymastichus coffea]
MHVDRGFLNVMILSWGMMLVFTAFQTMGNIQKAVLESIGKDDPNFKGDGYVSLAIIYGVFALCNWLAPSFISMTGPRTSVVVGSACYVLFIASFLFPRTEFLYIASVIVGVGGALVWTGQGTFLTVNSNEETMSRNSGLFWAIFQSSLFIGNIFVYFVFTDDQINADRRNLTFKVLTSVSIVGLCLLLTMKRPPQNQNMGPAEGVSSNDKELRIPESPKEKPLLAAWHALTDAIKLFFTTRMLMLSLTFIYTGLSLTFFSSVYSSSISFTESMGPNRNSLLGLSGICVGIGEVVGGAVFGMLASKCGGCSGWPVVSIGFAVHAFAFIAAVLNLPNAAPFGKTSDIGVITPSPGLAMVGSLTLGFGDACFNTQVYSLLGVLYSTESSSAFALFKFCQSVAAAISFAYTGWIGLHGQLGILIVFLVLGTVAFCVIEVKYRRAKRLAHLTCPEIDVSGNNALYNE